MRTNIAEEKMEIKEFTVSELSQLIKRVIDQNFDGYIKIKGEISGLKIAASGHAYFNLKDENALITCTCWRSALGRINFRLEEGMEVVATGKLTIYQVQSKYQFSVDKIEVSGTGALMELLLKRKEALAKEGLFDASRKKPIPFFPKRIGVITSPVGSVIQDIIHRVKERCPAIIMLWPVAVQGETCAFEVSSAINGFNNIRKEVRPDVIIVARGGGSIEDLWGFNEEIVARATANSSIPIISAIGHETDFTLIDFASSLRAPTPTAAAEIATPVLLDIKAKISMINNRINNSRANIIYNFSSRLSLVFKSLAQQDRFLYQKYQRLDEAVFRLKNSLPNNLKVKYTHLKSLRLPINVINSIIQKNHTSCINLFKSSTVSINGFILSLANKISLNNKMLETMSTDKVLARGFTITRSQSGTLLTSKELATNEISIEVEWKDGKLILINKKP
ncbi:MAG: exodeoxyribonuclease VII large subunit [Rickettsiaceae bacterium]|nr:exodeoxyribonuclease VII large subunit [Rickettsiaceae bacterium]